MAPRLKEKYVNEIAPALKDELGLGNVNQVPRLEKIVVNMGVGAAAGDAKLMNGAVEDLRKITGQQPRINRAKKSIAAFHLRGVRQSALRLPSAATVCGSSWTVCCPSLCLVFATSAVSTLIPSTVAATTPSVFRSS